MIARSGGAGGCGGISWNAKNLCGVLAGKAQQLGQNYWLCVVWDPLGQSPELVAIQNPAQKRDRAKREIIASRYFEIPAEAICK